MLTRDISCIHLYGNSYIDPLKFGTWVLTREWMLTREWVLAQDTIVYIQCNMSIKRVGDAYFSPHACLCLW